MRRFGFTLTCFARVLGDGVLFYFCFGIIENRYKANSLQCFWLRQCSHKHSRHAHREIERRAGRHDIIGGKIDHRHPWKDRF